MIRSRRIRALLATALALTLAGAAHAQAPAGERSPEQARKQLAEAREDLARAAARVAELTRGHIDADPRLVELRSGAHSRPVLGVVLAPDEEAGVRVSGVTPGSAAAEAGLRSGDRLLSIDGTTILGSTGTLRVDNARRLAHALEPDRPVAIGYQRDGRRASVEATPRAGRGIVMLDGDTMRNAFGAMARDLDSDAFRAQLESVSFSLRSGEIASEVSRALAASGLSADCEGEDCRAPMLLSAFRWSGLNLAAVDPQLGRYFGAERGVLVLSSGGLDALEAGDVIQRIDGEAVSSPREVMAALRDKPADASVSIAYLRDRRPATAEVTVPRMRSLRIPAPPAPPAAPAPPSSTPARPPAPPAPPPPPSAA